MEALNAFISQEIEAAEKRGYQKAMLKIKGGKNTKNISREKILAYQHGIIKRNHQKFLK